MIKPWDSRFHDEGTAGVLGDRRFKYVPFFKLSAEDQRRARAMYPHKSVGAKYDFVDEHYYYPVDRDGRLARAGRRTLAIPQRLILDEKYMASLGYEMNPEWAAKTASDSQPSQETTMTMPKFAAEDANKILTRLDRMAKDLMAKHESWGMPFEDAKAFVNALDKTADEVEVAAYGQESLESRQVEVLAKSAKVVQRDSDESYMDTFNSPQQPHQTDGDEPYMKAYADDQSQAVQTGKSTTGRPLAP